MDPMVSDKPDRISELCDDILCNIFSFLDAREVVATSVLSKKLGNSWRCARILKFDDLSIEKLGGIRVFERVMEQLLASLSSIKGLRLQTSDDEYDPKLLKKWISVAVKKNLGELDLALGIGEDDDLDVQHFKVPLGLFSCQTLVILKLKGLVVQLHVTSRSTVDLPKLKVLHLSSVIYSEPESASRVLAGCPVLEELLVVRAYFDLAVTYEINVPHLKSVTLIIPDSWVKVNDVAMSNMDSLVHARFDLTPEMYCDVEDAADILGPVSNVKFLELSQSTMKVLERDLRDEFPTFGNLVKVHLDGLCCFWGFLHKLLHHSLTLKHLTLGKQTGLCVCKGSENWSEPQDIPECMTSTLTTVYFQDRFAKLTDDAEFAQYMLRYSLVLERMQISFWHEVDPIKKSEVRLEMQMCQKGSQTCHLEFV